MAPLAAGHLQFQRFVSCASQFAQWVDDSMALRPARRTSSGAGAARVTSPAAFQSAATCCRSGKRNCQASVRAAACTAASVAANSPCGPALGIALWKVNAAQRRAPDMAHRSAQSESPGPPAD